MFVEGYRLGRDETFGMASCGQQSFCGVHLANVQSPEENPFCSYSASTALFSTLQNHSLRKRGRHHSLPEPHRHRGLYVALIRLPDDKTRTIKRLVVIFRDERGPKLYTYQW